MNRPALTSALLAALTLACNAPQAPSVVNNNNNNNNIEKRGVQEPSPVAQAGGPAEAGPPVRKDGTIYAETEQMGTRMAINIHVGDASAAAAGAAIEAAVAEIERLEQIMSEWRPSSELSQLNAGAGGPMRPLSPELYEILQRSKELAERTGGAFDPTFYAVGELWRFDPGARPPTREAITARLPLVDWRAIELDPASRSGRLARAGMKVGLGAIAKGYAVDRASALLRDRGFLNHIVEGGGDTYVSGTKAGKPWMVGIQDPDGAGSVAAIPARDRAVVTSGDYQRFIEFEGTRYSHILDPRTGFPVPQDRSTKSITVLADNATDADALATALAVMGPDAGLKLVEAQPGLDAALITHTGELRVSADLAEILVYPPGKQAAPNQGPARE